MTDTAIALPDPLHSLHEQAEAEFQNYVDLEIVSTFGEPQAEYAAVRKSAGIMDLPHRGIIEVTGKDRLSFLNNLLTNQTYDKATKTGMATGTGVYAFLLNAKSGRVSADCNVIERGDRTLLETDARLIPAMIAAFDKYRFAEAVQFRSTVGELHEIAVHGPRAAELLGVAALPVLGSAAVDVFDTPVTLWRDDPTGASGYHLIVDTKAARQLWVRLVSMPTAELAGDRQSRPIGWAVFNAARIENGRPLFGIDFDDTILPAETGQTNRAVSFTKGCYPGQEIVARMHARQVVAKQVVGLKFADDAMPIAGAPVTDDAGNAVGGVTSSTISPVLSNGAIALAIVKRPLFAVGTVLNVPAEGRLRRAVVTEFPFVKV